MKYSKPNFEHEWSEALRYREFEKMGKDGWIEKASKDFEISNFKSIEDILNNVDLDYDTLDDQKKERFEKSFEEGDVEIPMAVKFSDTDYDLLGGNTRLAGLIKNGINPKIWVVDMTKKKKEVDEKKNPHDEDDDKDDIFPTGSSDWRKKKENKEQWEREEDPLDDNLEEPDDDDDYRKPKNKRKPKLKHKSKPKKEVKETGADSSGSFSGPLMNRSSGVIKRPISKIPNFQTNEQELDEVTDASSSGAFDVPAFGKSTSGGRRNPLKIDGPDSIYKGRAVKDKNFPKWGGPDSVFVKVKEKCKKFPYCNQGNTGAIEIVREDKEIQDAITQISKKYGISHQQVENIVLNEIKQIFI
jgi:hypothetical protein